MKEFFRKHKSICTVIGIVAVAYALIMLSGMRFCAVQSGSMEPNIPTYSMCLIDTRASYDSLSVGDVVVYTRPTDGNRIIHRIISIEDAGAVTRGDANRMDDGVSVTPKTLYGKYVAHVPYVANFYNFVHSGMGTAAIAAAFALLIMTDHIEYKEYKRRQRDVTTATQPS